MINKSNISIDFFKNSFLTKDKDEERKTHLIESLKKVKNKGAILEFGVYNGTTINIISDFFPNEVCFGFDSFEGLPEDWIIDKNSKKTVFTKNYFAVNKLPEVNNNVKLVKGLFNDTLPLWVKENQSPIKFLHIDCDLYSSTKQILFYLNHLIIPGTVIVFDELYYWEGKKYSNWEEGEYKALKEWVIEFDRELMVLHRNRHMQAAIEVVK